MIDQAGIPQDINPAKGSDDETDPEGKHDQNHQVGLEPGFSFIKKIRRDIAHDQAQNHGFQGHPQGL